MRRVGLRGFTGFSKLRFTQGPTKSLQTGAKSRSVFSRQGFLLELQASIPYSYLRQVREIFRCDMFSFQHRCVSRLGHEIPVKQQSFNSAFRIVFLSLREVNGVLKGKGVHYFCLLLCCKSGGFSERLEARRSCFQAFPPFKRGRNQKHDSRVIVSHRAEAS